MTREKTAAESRVEMVHVMFPMDANQAGNVHDGTIMKLIDTAAGIVALRHCRTNVVTASMDRLDFHEPVFWEGKSAQTAILLPQEIFTSKTTQSLMELNQLSYQIIKAAINVHKELGPWLLETVYQFCIGIELRNMGITEVPLPISYRGQRVHEEGFRIDLLVEDTIVVELKSVEKVRDVHKKQLLTYLRLAKKPLGLLINFNEVVLKNGIIRIINTPPSAD